MSKSKKWGEKRRRRKRREEEAGGGEGKGEDGKREGFGGSQIEVTPLEISEPHAPLINTRGDTRKRQKGSWVLF